MNDVPMPWYMEPQWFFPAFAVIWLGVSGALAHIGGWASLAGSFRATQPATGERFRFVSGSMGTRFLPVRYGGCLFVTVSRSGIHLSILFLFRFQSPALFIPWTQIETITEKRLLVGRETVFRVRNRWPTFSVRGRAGQFIWQAYSDAPSQHAP